MKVAVSGAAGRMGRRVVALAGEHPSLNIVGALEAPGFQGIGKDAGEVAGIGKLGVLITDKLKPVLAGCDVLIEFSAPEPSLEHIKAAADAGKAIVVGTTGFTEKQREEIAQAGPRTRCLVAPNMSLGVNLLFNVAQRVAAALGSGYDVEIIEAHHRMKKDAPSGTAVKLAELISESLGRDYASVGVHGRKGLVGERTPKEIGVMAVRGGDIVGEHTVMFVTTGERLELIHRAHSRDAFARGAVQAALWLVSQPNGLYDMQDVLGLKG
ncbi:MAG: 4-hydroxy-tetrahydrodipicolinate reductase [Deltaproteobacteria bacterium]|nr:4-hydroxy-tetrahydrodipicolinate reductase [Deltaproteobacteria bacterium]